MIDTGLLLTKVRVYAVDAEVDLQLELEPPHILVSPLEVLGHCLEELLPESAIELLQDALATLSPSRGDLVLGSEAGLFVLEDVAGASIPCQQEVLPNEAHQLLLFHLEVIHRVVLLVQVRLLRFLDCFRVLFDVAHVWGLRLRRFLTVHLGNS